MGTESTIIHVLYARHCLHYLFLVVQQFMSHYNSARFMEDYHHHFPVFQASKHSLLPCSPPAAWLWQTGHLWSSDTSPSGSGRPSGPAPVWAEWRHLGVSGSALPGQLGTHRTQSWKAEKFTWLYTAEAFNSYLYCERFLFWQHPCPEK